jgi:NAD(P)-dependent dehydrogenase (short-subunit alcohol dehydrogenase family)
MPLPTPRAVTDALLEAPIVTSFTNLGYQARRRLHHWRPLDSYDLSGKVVVLTGGSTGIGFAAAQQFASLGATLIMVSRSQQRIDEAAEQVRRTSGNPNITALATDMGDLVQVRHLANEILDRVDHVDVLAHNAGALTAKRFDSPQGIEATVASHVVGPFLLTTLLLDALRRSGAARVLTMSSGGMYSAGVSANQLEMTAADYRGTTQYARAKRAQVTLNEMWADRHGTEGIHFHSMHPGWADTPGVDSALPGFGRVMGPLLRTPLQGADTLVWLAADEEPLHSNGRFWLDRQVRSIHKLPSTRRTDTPARRAELWDRVELLSGRG